MVPPSPGICMLKCSNITVVNKSATTGYRKQLSPSLMQSVEIEDAIYIYLSYLAQNPIDQHPKKKTCSLRLKIQCPGSLASGPTHWHQCLRNGHGMQDRSNRSTLSISPLAYELQGQNGRQQPLGENMNRMTTMTKGILKWMALQSSCFNKKRSQTQQCIPAHLLAFLFMRPWSFGSVLQVRLNQIKSYQIHFSNVFVCKNIFVLPSDPPAQVVQHVHFQGAGTDVRCLPHKNEVDLDAPYDHVTLQKSGANLFLYLSKKTST